MQDFLCYSKLLSFFQEFRESKRRHESRMVEIDGGRQQDYESKLSEALIDLRKQHEEQLRIYKDEIEKTYNSKVIQQSKSKLSSVLDLQMTLRIHLSISPGALLNRAALCTCLLTDPLPAIFVKKHLYIKTYSISVS